VRAFGEADELFVPLDEEGEPIVFAEPLLAEELSEDLEYETIANAIQLGLGAMGAGAWDELFNFITAPGTSA
jgi:hypothetical protein